MRPDSNLIATSYFSALRLNEIDRRTLLSPRGKFVSTVSVCTIKYSPHANFEHKYIHRQIHNANCCTDPRILTKTGSAEYSESVPQFLAVVQLEEPTE